MATPTQAPNGLVTISTAAGLAMTFSAIHGLETNSLVTIPQSNWEALSENTMSMEGSVVVDLERSGMQSNTYRCG